MMRHVRTFVRTLAPFALWLFFVRLMYRSYYVFDPPNPALQGTDAYGHNHAGVFTGALWFMAAELAVLYLIVRPWSYRRSFKRLIVALTLFVPWMTLSGMALMHAGAVVALHFFWLFVLDTALIICLLVSVIATQRHAARRQPPAPA